MNSRGGQHSHNPHHHLPPSYHQQHHSLAIRQEIQRFESVHPSIYAIYDLIELIPDVCVAQQIRDHVVCIEDSFVNSQEWTLSRGVPDLRLGIVGSLSSGKSALVHRYLTGSYMQEESPEGGRFKKEILIDNQSYLLLIRDEGGPPELQFTAWVDAVIFVFSLENEASFNAIYNYYTKMAHYRNAEIPLILVGTQDAISENNPRVIDDSRARKLASDLKRCSYYETCATYGLNVERVFQDACQKIVQQRQAAPGGCMTPTGSRPSTPAGVHSAAAPVAPARHHHNGLSSSTSPYSGTSPSAGTFTSTGSPSHSISHKDSMNLTFGAARQAHTLSSSSHLLHKHQDKLQAADEAWPPASGVASLLLQAVPTENNNVAKFAAPLPPMEQQQQPIGGQKDLPTPSSTPTTSRKSRRRSNLFTPSKKGDDKLKNGDIGVGRAIPLKQGYLYKKSSKTLNKEWKKKYVTLCDDGRLTYHPSLHDYMDDVHGKEISLQYVTVKVPGQKPRGSKSIITVASTNGSIGLNEGIGGLSLGGGFNGKDRDLISKYVSGDEGVNSSYLNGDLKTETPNVKKRHRRIKSSGLKNSELDESDCFEFFIVSLDNKQWHFEAGSSEDRDEWVSAIEQQILNSLQGNESAKGKKLSNSMEAASIQSIRSRVPGNDLCVDCNAPNPDWASLNLGVLMCIECSGIHRNLGSHISRVRSLGLDDWPPGHLSVMLAIGNKLANSVWESEVNLATKPKPNSSRETKERWIRTKYDSKEFLPAPNRRMPLGQQLIDAICKSDVKAIITVLAQATPDQVNCVVGNGDLRTPLHLACTLGNLAVAQLLIWHNADVKAIDHDGRSCLAYARAAATLTASKAQAGNGVSAEVGAATARGLVDLLQQNGCPDLSPTASSGTLPRRRGSLGRRDASVPSSYEKLPSSVL